MEFFFLTQNVSLEIFVLIGLFIILTYIWSQELYAWLERVWHILKNMKHSRPIELPPLTPSIPETLIQDTDTIIDKKIEPVETEKIEKIDTSQVEKLTNLVSSVRTLIARGMIIEAQTLIVE